jgi:circadian clock protein KaiB
MMGDAKTQRKAQGKKQTTQKKKNGAARNKDDGAAWSLRLYVAGRSPRSQTAYSNLRALCEKHIPGRYSIEVIDLLVDPRLAKVDQILAIPTLVRKDPPPVKRIIGDLSNSERAIVALDLAQLDK